MLVEHVRHTQQLINTKRDPLYAYNRHERVIYPSGFRKKVECSIIINLEFKLLISNVPKR